MSKEDAAAAAAWFSEALGQPCSLVRHQEGTRKGSSVASESPSDSQDGLASAENGSSDSTPASARPAGAFLCQATSDCWY